MHIGIYEAGVHEQYLLAVVRVAAEINAQVSVFTAQNKYDQIESEPVTNRDNIDWETQPNESISLLLDSVQRRSADFDALLYVSLYGNLLRLARFVRLDVSCPELLFMYNLNTWFSNDITTDYGIRVNLKRLLRGRVRRRMNGLIVEYPQLRPYATERYGYERSVQAFPPVVYDGNGASSDMKADNDRLVISVPGNVESSRRDYETLLNGLESSFAAHPDQLELRLVGPPIGESGHTIHERCEGLRERGFKIVTFDHRLDHEEFSEQMRESDLIISPIRYSSVGETGAAEIYGVSKGSGSVFDAIRYGIPAVFPEYFPVPGYIRSSTSYYQYASDITSVVNKFITKPDYRKKMNKQAHENASRFTLNAQSERLASVIDAVQ